MQSETFGPKDRPELWRIIKHAFPSYRKRSALFHRADSVAPHGRYWDGGTHSEWAIVSADGTVQRLPGRQDFPFTSPDPEIDLLQSGRTAVEAETFCGKPATACVYRAAPMSD